MAALRSALRDQAAPTVRDAAVLVAVAAAAGAVAAWRMSRGLPRSRLVDDMLRLARLGQRPGQSAEPVDMTAVVAGCAERVRIADPARTWRVRIADDLATVGDEELLRRAVDNLLMNVLVHTPADAAGAISHQRVRNRRAGHHRCQRRRPRRSARPAAAHLRALLPRRSPVPAPRLGSRPGHRRRDRLRARRPRVCRARRLAGPARPADHADSPGRWPAGRRLRLLRRRTRASHHRQMSPVRPCSARPAAGVDPLRPGGAKGRPA